MKNISRLFLSGALTLILLTTACAGQEGSPTAAGTTAPGDQTASPAAGATQVTGTAETATTSPDGTPDTTPTATPTASVATDTPQSDATQTPAAPEEVLLLDCQYCIAGMAHALLVLPENATFQTVSDTTLGPDMGCNIVDTYNGRQTAICRAEENTSLNLNICTNGANCTPLLLELQPCPTTGTPEQGATNTPEAGVPTNTAVGTTGTPGTPTVVTETPAVGSPTATP